MGRTLTDGPDEFEPSKFDCTTKHLNSHNILTPSQHDFRSKRSCETQLIATIQGIAKNLKSGKDQVDVILSDFAKDFD